MVNILYCWVNTMEDSQKYYEIEILTRELKEGKEAAFDYLFRTRYKNLCRFAATFVVQFDVAEDIVQELFSNIWAKKMVFQSLVSFKVYLYNSVRNASLDYLKHKNIEGSYLQKMLDAHPVYRTGEEDEEGFFSEEV